MQIPAQYIIFFGGPYITPLSSIYKKYMHYFSVGIIQVA